MHSIYDTEMLKRFAKIVEDGLNTLQKSYKNNDSSSE